MMSAFIIANPVLVSIVLTVACVALHYVVHTICGDY